eukprot:PITA_23841
METVKPLENVLCMKGGSGDSSYAYNSPSVQLKMLEALKPILEHGISQNLRTIMNTGAAVFRIADLGCATGMNTFLAADTIVTAIKSTFTRHSMDVPEFQLYFGDLPSNDFNTLLRTLPPFLAGDMTVGDAKAVTAAAHGERKPPARRFYFAAAVSGSHYGRLFPRQSLHFCHSSVSLHWLSQVPASVQDRNSPVWNSGHVYISSDAVANAYLDQFRQDFTAFLEARAEEIIPGGCMFIALVGRSSGDAKEQRGFSACAHYMEAAFKELVDEGLIEEEKLDSFNIPFYDPSVEELQSIVKTENSFEIVSMSLLKGFPLHPLCEVREGEEAMFGKTVGNFYRAMFENIVATHLGADEDLVDEFFSRFANRAAANYEEYSPNTLDLVVAFLVRKGA